jgi:hypothetical protein
MQILRACKIVCVNTKNEVEIPTGKNMTMAKTRKKQERDQWDDLLDAIDFKGLTQE